MELEPLPSKGKLQFKDEFEERYSKLTNLEKFKEHSLSFLRDSIRINTLKTNIDECLESIRKKDWVLESIPWCKEGFWIKHEERRDIGNLWEHHMGKIYSQSSTSMIPPLILEPKPGEAVLDMAASPGSKTTQMGAMMENKGVLVANDVDGKRMAPLGTNTRRIGLSNYILTEMPGQNIKDVTFDKILLDAPCSSTGTIADSPEIIGKWNKGMIRRISSIQKELIQNAANILKPGGELVYSTCTMEPQENEEVIDYILNENQQISLQKINEDELEGLNTSSPIKEFNDKKYNKNIDKTMRIWPQDNHTEGFYIAKLKKQK